MEQSKDSLGKNKNSQNKNYRGFEDVPPSRFYTSQEEVTLRFYQTPKGLFKNPLYGGLGLGPKLMYSILRDRLDLSIKNDWKDKNGFIYLVFSIEELSALLEINKETVTTYKRELVKYRLIIDKRLGQGKSNLIYILKPEIKEFQNTDFPYSRERKNSIQENGKSAPIDTNVNNTKRENNVKSDAIFKTNKKEKRSPEKEYLAEEMADQLNDDHSLGFYRKIADMVPENLIFQALSEVKDAFLTGRVKKSKAALFTTVIQGKAQENNINLDIKKTGM